ncbi:asparagine synthase (glutamine-hydrolyzing) [candidate division KSB1 bacterium]|nr:asparagine synthase (glutamine-hydrolyzing) [candidate division KSB1 bacterium]
MCGICGVTYFDRERNVSELEVKGMCDVIRHRGPDDQGWITKGNYGIGMRRLSIIDLFTGRQPIANEDGSIWIVFNGEIYNHMELRDELVKKGHTFQTKCDTEAIVHAYEEYGEDCPKKLNGMFGFAILDQKKQTLFLARDRLGIKPLYYYNDSGKFAFGSELKSILQVENIPREVDKRALDIFLTFEYIPSPYSIFEGIRKLPPGHSLTLKDGRITIKEYWDLRFDEKETPEDELCEQLLDLFQDAVKIRLMSDVPLGAFLSGGIDSSAIVAMMSRVMDRPVKTFSIAFKEDTYNESPYAQQIANRFNTEHHVEVIEPNALELTEKLVGFLDEPFGDFSIFPTYLVSKMARKHVTVSLSGDGGDELFAGYDTYIANKAGRAYERLPGLLRGAMHPILNRIPPTEKKKGLINRAKRFVEGMQLPPDLEHTRWMIFLQEAEKSKLYSDDLQDVLNGSDSFEFIRSYFNRVNTTDPLNRQLYVDIKSYLVDDILVKVDRMSMATSLETRVPFLDHRFVEFTATIPSRLKLQGKSTKYLLKKAMQGILPPEILNRGKEGFSIPIKNWLKTDLKSLMLEVLEPQKIKREGFFNANYVEQLKKEHLSGKKNHSHRLWSMMVFGIWQNLYLRGERINEKAIQTSNEFAEV